MKKYFLGFAALSMLLATGCANESVEKAGDNNGVISFENYLGKQSRASEVSLNTLEAAAVDASSGIAVRAYKTADAAPWESWSVYYSDNEWTYDNPTIQPGFNLDYFAWYPAGAVTTLSVTSAGAPASFGYTVPAVAAQEDLIVASNMANGNPAIDLAFSHTLSQVNFAIQQVSDVQVQVTGITLKNIAQTATYTYGSGWGTASSPVEYAYDFATTTTDTGTAIIELGTTTNALMLMPQTLGNDACFEISFNLLNRDGSVYLVGSEGSAETATVYFRDFSNTASVWEAGKKYNYLIDFSSYLADRLIKFSVSVDDWDETNTGNSYLAVEVAQADAPSIVGAIESVDAYKTSGYGALQVTVNGSLTSNIELDLSNLSSFNIGDEIVIYVGGLDAFDITVTSTSATWSATKDVSNTFVTLEMQ